jgi:hypothetical protein
VRHFFRCPLHPEQVLTSADAFFPTIGLSMTSSQPRTRTYSGSLGSLTVRVRMEGGHYTFVEADTDQMGESRLDRNVKRYFVQLHKLSEPTHTLDAAY